MAQLKTNPLCLTWDNGDKTWIVVYPWFSHLENYHFYIQMGFNTDIASIPRVIWWVPGFAPMELGLDGPVVHDWLYQHGGISNQEDGTVQIITRKEVDNIFRRLMGESGVGWFRRWVAWMWVRCLGWLAWKRAEPTHWRQLKEIWACSSADRALASEAMRESSILSKPSTVLVDSSGVKFRHSAIGGGQGFGVLVRINDLRPSWACSSIG
jgi:hypothetical protein